MSNLQYRDLLLMAALVSVVQCEKSQVVFDPYPIKTNMEETNWDILQSSLELSQFLKHVATLDSNTVQSILYQAEAETKHNLLDRSLPGTSFRQCKQDLSGLPKLLKSSIEAERTAGAYYLDAASKIPHGIMYGKWSWFGGYDECKNISKVYNSTAKTSFGPEYFTVFFLINNKTVIQNYPLSVGFCLPNSCDNVTVKDFMNNIIKIIKTSIPQLENITISAIGAAKDVDRQLHSDTGAIAFLSVAGILCALMVFGTFVDFLLSPEQSPNKEAVRVAYDEPYPEQGDRSGLLANELFANNIQEDNGRCKFCRGKVLEFCKAFSLLTNGKKLFSSETASGPLACLNGIRVLSMWWVILGHSYAFIIYFSDNISSFADIVTRFTFQPIMNGTYSVDSFFFLSGLLVSYLALKEYKDKGTLNWAYYIVHRYWRLTPLYAFVIFYFAFLSPYTFNGPMTGIIMQSTGLGEGQCKKYWWTNLLYINNFYPNYGNLSTQCLGWGWYLANDMQFYLFVAPIIILGFRFHKLVGLAASLLFILACIFTRLGLVIYYGIYEELNAQPTKHVHDPLATNGVTYARPYARWSVYVVGMLVGYILASSNNRIRIHRSLAFVGWCAAIGSGLAVIYGQYYYNHHAVEGAHMTLTASAFYISLSRTVWGLCLAWVVIACVSGNGSLVCDILSWKIWAPLGRLTYSAYLVHPIIIFTYFLNQRQMIYVTDVNMVYLFIGHLVTSYAIGFGVSMLVEAPMIRLDKLLLMPLGKSLNLSIGNVYRRVRYRNLAE